MIQTFNLDFEALLLRAGLDRGLLKYNVKRGIYTNYLTRQLLAKYKANSNMSVVDIHNLIQALK